MQRPHPALQTVAQAHQNQCRFGVLVQKLGAGRQGDTGTMIASHAVNRNSDHERQNDTDNIKKLDKSGVRETDDSENTKARGYTFSSLGLWEPDCL